jgi:hypothetical protein
MSSSCRPECVAEATEAFRNVQLGPIFPPDESSYAEGSRLLVSGGVGRADGITSLGWAGGAASLDTGMRKRQRCGERPLFMSD